MGSRQSLLIEVLESDAQLVEDAVRYVIFLVDADKLFDIALGMYDFTLVLLIAQHSQKVRIPILIATSIHYSFHGRTLVNTYLSCGSSRP